MSHVTDVIVTTGLADGNMETVEHLNEYFRVLAVEAEFDPADAPQLQEMTAFYSKSGKAIQARIWVGAFNYMDHGRFIKAMRSVPWHDPEEVQLFVNTEHGEEGFQRVEWREKPQPQSPWVECFGREGE